MRAIKKRLNRRKPTKQEALRGRHEAHLREHGHEAVHRMCTHGLADEDEIKVLEVWKKSGQKVPVVMATRDVLDIRQGRTDLEYHMPTVMKGALKYVTVAERYQMLLDGRAVDLTVGSALYIEDACSVLEDSRTSYFSFDNEGKNRYLRAKKGLPTITQEEAAVLNQNIASMLSCGYTADVLDMLTGKKEETYVHVCRVRRGCTRSTCNKPTRTKQRAAVKKLRASAQKSGRVLCLVTISPQWLSPTGEALGNEGVFNYKKKDARREDGVINNVDQRLLHRKAAGGDKYLGDNVYLTRLRQMSRVAHLLSRNATWDEHDVPIPFARDSLIAVETAWVQPKDDFWRVMPRPHLHVLTALLPQEVDSAAEVIAGAVKTFAADDGHCPLFGRIEVDVNVTPLSGDTEEDVERVFRYCYKRDTVTVRDPRFKDYAQRRKTALHVLPLFLDWRSRRERVVASVKRVNEFYIVEPTGNGDDTPPPKKKTKPAYSRNGYRGARTRLGSAQYLARRRRKTLSGARAESCVGKVAVRYGRTLYLGYDASAYLWAYDAMDLLERYATYAAGWRHFRRRRRIAWDRPARRQRIPYPQGPPNEMAAAA